MAYELHLHENQNGGDPRRLYRTNTCISSWAFEKAIMDRPRVQPLPLLRPVPKRFVWHYSSVKIVYSPNLRLILEWYRFEPEIKAFVIGTRQIENGLERRTKPFERMIQANPSIVSCVHQRGTLVR